MKAELRRLHSPDVQDLEAYVPGTSSFCVLIQAMIGPELGEGEESFDFIVCSPAWLSDEVGRDGYRLGRFHLIMRRFDLVMIREVIEGICREATGPDWSDVTQQIARHGRWEFEDYQLPS